MCRHEWMYIYICVYMDESKYKHAVQRLTTIVSADMKLFKSAYRILRDINIGRFDVLGLEEAVFAIKKVLTVVEQNQH